MSQRSDILIVVNPAARGVRPGVVGAVAAAWQAVGTVVVAHTQRSGDATMLARDAVADRIAVVVGIGGDGTQNELAQGLVGSQTALAPVPGGTTNVLARSLGTGRRVSSAARALARGYASGDVREIAMAEVRTSALHSVGTPTKQGLSKVFVVNVGVGLDARVVHRVERRPDHKRRFGHAHFALAAMIELVGAKRSTKFVISGRTDSGALFGPWYAAWIVVQRTDPFTYGGPLAIRLTPPGPQGVRATMTAVIVPSVRLPGSLRFVPALFHGGMAHPAPLDAAGSPYAAANEPIYLDRVAKLSITSADGSDLVAQTDGEPLPCGPQLVVVDSGAALRLVWPVKSRGRGDRHLAGS